MKACRLWHILSKRSAICVALPAVLSALLGGSNGLAEEASLGTDREPGLQSTTQTAVPSLAPSWQRVVVDNANQGNEPLGTVPLSIDAGDSSVTVLTVLLDCACLRLQTQLPLVVPAGERRTLDIEVALLLSGPKTIQVITDQGPLLSRVDLSGRQTPRSGKAILEEAWQAVPPGGSMTLVLHNLRSGDPAACRCAETGLGGREALLALNNWINEQSTVQNRALPKRWLSGSMETDAKSVASALKAVGWQKPTAEELVVSARPLVRLRTTPKALVIPAPGVGPLTAHARLITPPLTDGTGVEAILRREDGSVSNSFTIPVDQSFLTGQTP